MHVGGSGDPGEQVYLMIITILLIIEGRRQHVTAPCWNELEELHNDKADPEETLSKGVTRNFSYTEAGNKDCAPSVGKLFSYAPLGVKPCPLQVFYGNQAKMAT